MSHGIARRRLPLLAVMSALLLAGPAGIYAQRGQRGPAVPQTAKGIAVVDLTGTWVSVITEDWKYRMVTPKKGDYDSVPANPAGLRAFATWDPAKDEAAGEQCKTYGAVGGMRLPGKLRISWQDEGTLKIEMEAGTQTRLIHFGVTGSPAGEQASWQGFSAGLWEAAITGRGQPRKGDLKVVTTHLRPGYVRKNGVLYSGNAELTEYFHRMTAPNGDQWLTLISELRDPQYYQEPWVISSHFKKVADNTPWKPEACSAR
jgi:hypothetical protein